MTDKNQSQHWADKLAIGINKWQQKYSIPQLHVDDMKTPSGRIHVGSLRGVLLHDVVAKVLGSNHPNLVSTYVFNDMDPMDGLPGYLPSDYTEHMGKPLYRIPRPSLESSGIDVSTLNDHDRSELEQTKSLAELYATDFLQVFRRLGCSQDIVLSHELYESGQMDEAIRIALDNVETLRRVYKEVADYQLPEKWYPFQVICPECGRLGSTLTTDWDGEVVTFECQPNKVEWAKGCGYHGKVSPFGGTGKLLWKVDWPAHWHVLGINIEGAGKDHTSAGGSRDMADVMIKEVYHDQVPFDIPYEWILVRGAKMSSSKGVGTSAREFTDLFPPEVGRFLFVNKQYNQVIDFDPTAMAIPDLFDEYDEAAHIYWQQLEGDLRLGRAFELAQIKGMPQPHYLPRFRDLALWMQYPEVDIDAKLSEMKGAPLTEQETAVVADRLRYARLWVDRYAPAEYQFTPRAEMPAAATQLSEEQRQFLVSVNALIDAHDGWDPAELQQRIFELAKTGIGPRPGFEAIYLAFLGKKSGPRAAWFVLGIDGELRRKRILELNSKQVIPTPVNEKMSSQISQDVKKTFPGIFFAEVIINDVNIQKQTPELETLKGKVLESKKGLTTEDISDNRPIAEYRKIFKTTGIDWHSKRPSPDALLRRIALNKGLYTVNTAVDAYNLAVIETGIGLGGFDADTLTFPVVMRFSKSGEEMLLLGDDALTLTKENQLVYADQRKVLTLNLNYRDINATKITEDTKNIALYADGAPGLSQDEVIAALKRGAEYIQRFCGGSIGEIKTFS